MNPIFKEVTISSYRGLQDISLTDLKQANILVGNNNSGKTSILEAISILCSPLDPFTWMEVSQRRTSGLSRLVRYIRPDLESIEWMFPSFYNTQTSESKKNISISAESSQLNYRLEVLSQLSLIKGSRNPSDDENQDNLELEDAELLQEGVEITITASPGLPLEQFTLFGNSQVNFQFWQSERFIYRSRSNKYFESITISPSYLGEGIIVKQFSSIIREDDSQKEELIKLIQLFDEDIIDIQVLEERSLPKLYLKHRTLGLTPLYIFGDGIKRLLGIAMNVLVLTPNKNGVLLIDEIETSMHKSILGDVFKWLISVCSLYNIQLFITTHSLEAVDAILMANSSVDNLTAFRLESNQKSPTKFTGNLLKRLRFDRGLDMR